MDIIHLGHSSFRIKWRNASLVTDPFSTEATGLKFPKNLEADIVTVSHQHEDHNFVGNGKWEAGSETLIISGPGEYESKGVKILGIAGFHDSSAGEERGKNTIFKIAMDGVNICHLGDLGDKLESGTVDLLDGVDILLIPVGGIYTINAKTASEIITQLEPKIVIPMHYKVPGLRFDLEPLENFLTEMGKPDVKAIPKLSISKDKLPEETEVIVLEN